MDYSDHRDIGSFIAYQKKMGKMDGDMKSPKKGRMNGQAGKMKAASDNMSMHKKSRY